MRVWVGMVVPAGLLVLSGVLVLRVLRCAKSLESENSCSWVLW